MLAVGRALKTADLKTAALRIKRAAYEPFLVSEVTRAKLLRVSSINYRQDTSWPSSLRDTLDKMGLANTRADVRFPSNLGDPGNHIVRLSALQSGCHFCVVL